MKLRVVTYNIHKGVMRAPWSGRPSARIHDLRLALGQCRGDLLFLQEVQGEHQRHAVQLAHWPAPPQHEYLAQSVEPGYHHAYGKSAVYLHGHHGNAILSRYPIVSSEHRDISDHVMEKRGALHVQIRLPMPREAQAGAVLKPHEAIMLHCFVVHLGLLAAGRMRQLNALVEWVRSSVPAQAPLIIAGDFNDWNNRLGEALFDPIALAEVHESHRQRPAARTFPAWLPWLRMDRIYQRGFRVEDAQVLKGRRWARLSDHVPVLADLVLDRSGCADARGH